MSGRPNKKNKVELKRLYFIRDGLFTQMDAINEFYESLDLSNLSETDGQKLELKGKILNSFYDKFNDAQLEIDLLDEVTDNVVRAKFDQIYFDLAAKFELFRKKSLNVNKSGDAGEGKAINKPNVKLPDIQLPVFTGQYDQWLEFRDTFESLIHNNSSLTDIEKFQYLKMAVKDKAASLLNALAISAANYEVARELLRERFENYRLIVQNHVTAVFEMPVLYKESHIKLRQMLDTVTKHLRALKSLGQPTEHWDTLIIQIIVSKLDSNTKKEWQEVEITSDLPCWNEMKMFLSKRCDILEAMSRGLKNQNSQIRTNVAAMPNNQLISVVCPICKGSHRVYKCDDFLKLNIPQRREAVTKYGLCFKCLNVGHTSRTCNFRNCIKCKNAHSTLLHIENTSDKRADDSRAAIQVCNIVAKNVADSTTNKYVILSTAIIQVYDITNKPHNVRALLDTGSQGNFITESMIKKLGLVKNVSKSNVIGVNNLKSCVKFCTNLNISDIHNSFQINVSCHILDNITSRLPAINISHLPIPGDIMLADPDFHQGGNIDILLGADIFWAVIGNGRREIGNKKPMLYETKFGWMLGGKLEVNTYANAAVMSNVCIHECKDLIKQVENFWAIENVGEKRAYTIEEQMCEDSFVKTHTRDGTGKFIVQMPLNDKVHQLGNSRENALKRFFGLERKFQRDKFLKQEYVKFMREYINLGHMTRAEPDEEHTLEYYMPHHAVFRYENNSRKIRVVFDGSMQTSTGVSLNQTQLVGPTIQSDLFSILIRFRQYMYVLTADIVKMYRQIWMAENHRPLQRIFWRENQSDPLVVYNLNTVTYGQACSPFLSVRSVTELGLQHENENPEIAEIILRDFYIDDLLTGCDDIDNLFLIKNELIKILNKGGFPLDKFKSNSSSILARDQNNSVHIGKEHKILGIHWCSEGDYLYYSTTGLNKGIACTKRTILSTVSQLFDPLGILGPIIVLGKILIQQLWKLSLDWDDPIPSNLEMEWIDFVEHLSDIKNLKIPRKIICDASRGIELHGFSDASELAYGACVYVKSSNGSDFMISLMCAKSRVAPLKSVTIPRLELCGAVLLSRLIHKIREALSVKINDIFYWTDSMVVIHWIKNTSTSWKTFIANRVAIIQNLTNTENWGHVSSLDNPADIISRGASPTELLNSNLWLHGPAWLQSGRNQWPNTNITVKDGTLLEAKQIKVNVTSISEHFSFCDKFSNFNTMLFVFGYILRFIHNTKNCFDRRTGNLDPTEVDKALLKLIEIIQREFFNEDIENIRKNGSVARNSSIYSLSPFMDKNNLLRVGGRLSQTSYHFNKQHPILLPKNHKFTLLLFEHKHKILMHCGSQTLLAHIREKYWPISGKSLSKQIIRNCIICFRSRPNEYKYKMGDLPSSRVTPSRPFSNTGTDFAGPFLLKDRMTRGTKLVKAYVCIFVCFAVRAVHFELVADLTTDSFLAALRRFVSRRGLCTDLYSDNGTNYIGAQNQLSKLYQFIKFNQGTINEFTIKQGIRWHFSPPASPHFGGFWESVVKIMKAHLYKTIGQAHLAYDEFVTLLTQIEACVNSRPLCTISEDPTDPNPLTPAHFLIGSPLQAVPERDMNSTKVTTLRRWQLTQQLTQQYWRQWVKEYISLLQNRTKWRDHTSQPIKVNDLVLIKHEVTPPLQWPLGRVVELHPGSDGVVRVITIKTAKGLLRRSCKKICKLPVTCSESDSDQ